MPIDRLLTQGEICLARQIFKNSIDYEKVKIRDYKYVFLQGRNIVMTPNGKIYAANIYLNDYSESVPDKQALFIHEMAHVWQYQNNILKVKRAGIYQFIRHLTRYGEAYKYTLREDKDLLEYNLEQQATIIEDYFRVFNLGEHFHKDADGNCRVQNPPEERNELLELVTARFINNPKYSHAR